jgi:arsenite/tail-anchored protein-transporting ATPase
MQIFIFTGNAGAGVSAAAAATALRTAQNGLPTLIASIGPSHSLSPLFETPISAQARPIATNLAACEIDVLADLSHFWQELNRRSSSGGSQLAVSGDELPVIPGADLYLGMATLSRQAAADYAVLVIDAGQHDGLLRALAIPDGFRWMVRLAFGLDRGPGRNMASMSRALLPATLLPFEWIGQIQDSRVELERIRDRLSNPQHTSVRYVLRPDRAALSEARLAIPALQLFELAVETLIAGPLLPADCADLRIAAGAAGELSTISQAAELWAPRPLLRMPLPGADPGMIGLNILADAIYRDQPPNARHPVAPPVERRESPDAMLAISLPGAPREALGLTISGDELIVRVGPYRRHLLLPASMRGQGNVRALRDGDQLIVRMK